MQRFKRLMRQFHFDSKRDVLHQYQPSKMLCSIRLPNFFLNELTYYGDGKNSVTFFIDRTGSF